ncbi:MAG: short-chain dehydrogenase [Halieaceae bacterium]|nr:short-chain dehydrogenase [Halieaceae bacterium]
MGRMTDKVAVITGGASGIGAAAAEKLLSEGACVVLGDIQEQAGADMVASLGDRSRFKMCDVTDEAQVEALIQSAVDEFGKIDVMFNNAGIVGALGPLELTTSEEWKFTLDILLNGVFYGMKHASKHMKKAGSGSIISMSSVAGVTGGLGPHAYAAAKHAVVGITRNLATEVCAYGVRVNCIAPYSVATPMVAQAYLADHTDIDATLKMLTDESPLTGRPGLADDVANAVLWLASDESGYTSGHTLTIDAGITTGSMAGPPRFSEKAPLMREAGKQGI